MMNMRVLLIQNRWRMVSHSGQALKAMHRVNFPYVYFYGSMPIYNPP